MNKAIILAAGEGTRMKSNKSKVLHKIMNRELLSYVIDSIKSAGVEEIIIVAGNNIDQLKKYEDKNIFIVKQEIGEKFPYGTGYAASMAFDYIDDKDNVFIMNGDAPLISEISLTKMLDKHILEKNDATVMVANINDPFSYGRIVLNENNKIIKIIEEKECTEDEKLINLINSGTYIFKGQALKESVKNIDSNNSKGEIYITDAIEILKNKAANLGVSKVEDETEILGINSKKQLSEVENILRKKINDYHMDNGVVLENPDFIFIEKNIIIGKDTVIQAGCRILGKTKIGNDCIIGAGSIIIDSVVENNVEIRNSVIEESYISEGVDIGPFAHLRPKSILEENVHIGNFVEIKNSTLKKGTKAGHLAYVGDAKVGENVNIGCGVVFVNYDGEKKYQSLIGDRAFLGSNSNIVAPVKVGDEAYIAAGSTITKDIPNKNLSIERNKQVNKENWTKAKSNNKKGEK